MSMREIRLDVVNAGWATTYQDSGRIEAERFGVPEGGSADTRSAEIANILVGNARDATLIEFPGELSLVPDGDVLISVTGAAGGVTINGSAAELWSPVFVPAHKEIHVAAPDGGARSYLAIAGAIDTPRFMGSAAPNARMGFPQTIGHGETVVVRSAFSGFRHPHYDRALFRLPVPRWSPSERGWTLRVVPGPHAGIPGLRELISASAYTVTARSNHIGVRLDGPVLHPQDTTEITSHGVPIGAVEIPHGDELIILGRYRSLTAGYPIPAFVISADQWMVGQLAPSRQVALHWVDQRAARQEAWQAERALQNLEAAADDVFTAVGIPLHRRAAAL